MDDNDPEPLCSTEKFLKTKIGEKEEHPVSSNTKEWLKKRMTLKITIWST